MHFYEDSVSIETPHGPVQIPVIIGTNSGLMLNRRNLDGLNGYILSLYPSGKAIIDLGLMDAPTKQIARFWLEEVADFPIVWLGTPEEVQQRVHEYFGNSLRDALIVAYQRACRRARQEEETEQNTASRDRSAS